MKTNIRPNRKQAAFSMIEMIGVLAVIAILAALLIFKVFDAINSAKINSTASSLGTVKTAVVGHYTKYGNFDMLFGTNQITTPNLTNYDGAVLLREALLDKPFESKIGTNGYIQLVACATAATVPTGIGASYWLSGQGTAANEVAPATMVVQAFIPQVALSDAIELNKRIDGPLLGEPDQSKPDLKGRVQYAASTAGGPVDVYIYIEAK
jgi:prepilin-type N-terminal cleavage/methylation domain-containing protein